MASVDAGDSHRPPPTVFLSYASEDREAARLIKDALPAFGLEVWYDESDLGGGELWDQKIRRQIRECDYFMPLVSARTEARHEGYFRREWRLAVERTLDMADDHPFLLPVVIDATDQAGARVPEKFLTVQWLRVPGGQPTAALETLCRRIASGGAAEPQAARKEPMRPGKAGARVLSPGFPEFPREEPGQRVRFWAHVVGWAFRCHGCSTRDGRAGSGSSSVCGCAGCCCPGGCTPAGVTDRQNRGHAARGRGETQGDFWRLSG